MKAHGFPPVCQENAEVLILGSMPGLKSLEEQQYYAHPRNSFWTIIAGLLNIDIPDVYDVRCQMLERHRIALWDVLQYCERAGSLDSAIRNDSVVVNDFQSFFARYKNIQHVFFNGRKAEQEYRKHVLPCLQETERGDALSYTLLPSTSPAMAQMTRAQKQQHWSCVVEALD